MKIKSDFITNSSSASFLLALKKETKIEDIKKHIKLSDVQEFSSHDWMGWVLRDEFHLEKEELELIPKADLADMVLENLLESILSEVKDGVELGEWDVVAGECGNESGNIFDLFLYDHGLPDTDFMKFKTAY